MKTKLILGVLAAVAIVGVVAIAANEEGVTGNDAPNGQHFNLNIIGVPDAKNENFDGGNGSRIFVLRDKPTLFYVHGDADTSYAILDHDGTDGKVGTGIADPGITFPYDVATGRWQVAIYVRLVGPKGSSIDWTSSYYDGSTWVEFASFTLDKSSKFSLKTPELLKDGYQDILWELDPVTKFRICQMRIVLVER